MNWEQLVKRQTKEVKSFWNEYKEKFDQLNADIALLLGGQNEATAPGNVRDKINRDREAWRSQWGPDGEKFQTMHETHLKQINDFFAKGE
ncbi:hypothetical protein Q4E93_09995 [Flavitalea sp. BT771]|uniref:hypothetical protein n=1 Tax=Flavitalea sp. BT771 TaxID=3063329 RepID=UPI0026E1FA35|nr:hypothetical protein [Flavitalea sp. BT771]MDO6430919.1 hypothetical protein [Flavitalea sp. BT771]MDV6218941.1 hypothetical protein [Flavitalea sp. BT771]